MSDWSCRCGAKNEAAWRYCEGCGRESTRPPLAVVPSPPPRSQWRPAEAVLPAEPPEFYKPADLRETIAKIMADAKERVVADDAPRSLGKRIALLSVDPEVRRRLER